MCPSPCMHACVRARVRACLAVSARALVCGRTDCRVVARACAGVYGRAGLRACLSAFVRTHAYRWMHASLIASSGACLST
eukprot:4790030-Alexandrium_andersonii.AAC.1